MNKGDYIISYDYEHGYSQHKLLRAQQDATVEEHNGVKLAVIGRQFFVKDGRLKTRQDKNILLFYVLTPVGWAYAGNTLAEYGHAEAMKELKGKGITAKQARDAAAGCPDSFDGYPVYTRRML